jgi:tetratricopeptide (TPR) repeat protein
MVIRNILEQNQYDYSSLENNSSQIVQERKLDLSTRSKKAEEGLNIKSVSKELGIPQGVITQMADQDWITLEKKGKKTWVRPSDFHFLENISILHQNGIDLEEQMLFFNSIQGIVEKRVQLELELLIKLLINEPNKNFAQNIAIEENIVQKFINKIRERRLQQYFEAHAEVMDNAYCASVDEGFALQAEEIMEDLQTLEASIDKRIPDVQKLIWLSTGYSCIGDLKRSLEFLNKALKIAPDNLEAKVKVIWYKRFAKRRQDVERLKARLIELVHMNPKHTLGHVFLVDWFVLDALSSDSASDIFESMKRCLDEIQKMECAHPQNPHDWALVQYTKGRVYATFPLLRDKYIDRGILSFEELLKSRAGLDKYYAGSMPFFPKWLWPNLLYTLGISYLKVKRYSEAWRVFKMAKGFKVAFPFQERLEKGMEDAKKGIGSGQ